MSILEGQPHPLYITKHFVSENTYTSPTLQKWENNIQRETAWPSFSFSIFLRLSFPRKIWNFEAGGDIAMETTIRPPAGVKDMVRERRLAWRDLEHKEPLQSNSHTLLSQTLVPESRKRGRRHALFSSQGHVRGHLMRVGCILGTCQVQNLSYRFYKLTGQRKREHSPPIHPRSPHSYGWNTTGHFIWLHPKINSASPLDSVSRSISWWTRCVSVPLHECRRSSLDVKEMFCDGGYEWSNADFLWHEI